MSVVLQRELAHGTMVLARVGVASDLDLLQEERALAQVFAGERRSTFTAGRVAVRRALTARGMANGPVLRDSRGAPFLASAPELSLSISHKDDLAVGLVGPRGSSDRVGIDIEIHRPMRFDIARRILTEVELAELARLPEAARNGFVLRRFSVKEAIYKAIDPFVRRYVAFREVTLRESGGELSVLLHLQPARALEVNVHQFEIELEEGRQVIVSTATSRSTIGDAEGGIISKIP